MRSSGSGTTVYIVGYTIFRTDGELGSHIPESEGLHWNDNDLSPGGGANHDSPGSKPVNWSVN